MLRWLLGKVTSVPSNPLRDRATVRPGPVLGADITLRHYGAGPRDRRRISNASPMRNARRSTFAAAQRPVAPLKSRCRGSECQAPRASAPTGNLVKTAFHVVGHTAVANRDADNGGDSPSRRPRCRPEMSSTRSEAERGLDYRSSRAARCRNLTRGARCTFSPLPPLPPEMPW